jgi:hypothetical protein
MAVSWPCDEHYVMWALVKEFIQRCQINSNKKSQEHPLKQNSGGGLAVASLSSAPPLLCHHQTPDQGRLQRS